jgi:hypothetical protein
MSSGKPLIKVEREGGRSATESDLGAIALAGVASSTGAGAAMSDGRKIRELTATSATRNTSTIKKGATYCRKNAIGRVVKTLLKKDRIS